MKNRISYRNLIYPKNRIAKSFANIPVSILVRDRSQPLTAPLFLPVERRIFERLTLIELHGKIRNRFY